MLGETNGFEGILVADLFYAVTLTDTVRRYITNPEKQTGSQTETLYPSKLPVPHKEKGRPFMKNGGLFPPKSFLSGSIPAASFAVSKNRIDGVLNAHALRLVLLDVVDVVGSGRVE